MTDPWAFGWAHVLTLIGFAITIVIAIGGFRTFERWKREKVEEKKIEIAFEALALSYESKYIFENIRSPMAFGYEWKDMPRLQDESEDKWNRRGPFYAVSKRINDNKDFFERAFEMQPRVMAIFGKEAEDIFTLMHRARREIEVSSQMLAWEVHNPAPDRNEQFWQQCRRDISDHGDFEPEKDKVGHKIREFRTKMEQLCRPVIDREFGTQKPRFLLSRLTHDLRLTREAAMTAFAKSWRRQ